MADAKRHTLNQQLDMEQILLEAQHRWLRPAEICEILRNHQKFHIAPEPPNKPPSGSLFLFDRKILRYFRKDGHNWRKKKDGKTVKEAHERLKADGVDVLHCYYAHGEENENFQRRSYWMLEETFMHIVLVHYLEVKGGKTSHNRNRNDSDVARSLSPVCSNSFTSPNQLPSHGTDTGSPSSSQTSEYDYGQSDKYQARSRYHPFPGTQQYENGQIVNANLSSSSLPVSSLTDHHNHQMSQILKPETDASYASKNNIAEVLDSIGLDLGYSEAGSQSDLPAWDEVLETNRTQLSFISMPPSFEAEATDMNVSEQTSFTFGELLTEDGNIKSQKDDRELQACHPTVDNTASSNVESEHFLEQNINSHAILEQLSLGLSNMEGDSLKSFGSFSKWMRKDFEEINDSDMKSASQPYWNFMESNRDDDLSMSNPEQDAFIVGPSVSQDQLFSIIDFSPNWAYNDHETKVLITGTFLKGEKGIENIKLSCMFGEEEVPAEVLADGILRCHAPPHTPGRVPFYITCSNRLACSEVREFEYRYRNSIYKEVSDSSKYCTNEMNFHVRLGKLMSLGSIEHPNISNISKEKLDIRKKISSLLMEADDRWFDMLKLSNDKQCSPDRVKDQLLQRLFKEKLHDWLLHKVLDNGKGANVLDEEGQGVIHLIAALGYDWAIKPIITAGVNINFRDAHGWTALHWAAFCGRERTVAFLVKLHAFSGGLTDPTPDFPSGRTPADLASANGHKGIAGFLAESSLTSHLSALTVNNTRGIAVEDVSTVGAKNLDEESTNEIIDLDTEAKLSLKDSLYAVRNATLAASRIHQLFRIDSFQRKQVVEYSDDQSEITDEHQALSQLAVKTFKASRLHDTPVHAAAVRIQNKYRGWKGRKDFLIARQRIVKIQAHVRGHQVRKRYKKICWTVGILEKVILRWRRKRSGLRGFRSESLTEGTSSMQIESCKDEEEEDDDLLKEGRKQSEARTVKALSRVRSMVQYPEAREQYRRLLTVVTELEHSSDMEEENLVNE